MGLFNMGFFCKFYFWVWSWGRETFFIYFG